MIYNDGTPKKPQAEPPVETSSVYQDLVQHFCRQGNSVNLIVKGELDWRALIHRIQSEELKNLLILDLGEPGAETRQWVISRFCELLGCRASIPGKPHDLAVFGDAIRNHQPTHLALLHADWLFDRHEEYGIEFCNALRWMANDRKWPLLIHSKVPYPRLIPHLPKNHPLSELHLYPIELG